MSSVLTGSLPARPWSMSGHATFDVDQYRVRGRFVLEAGMDGTLSFEFSGSTLLGGHREDVAVVLAGDTLRVFDRERGRFYQGSEVDDMVHDGTGVTGDWVGAIAHTAGTFRCPEVRQVLPTVTGAAGELASGEFRLDVQNGHLVKGTWPDPVRSDTFSDRLEVRYTWRGAGLSELVALLPERGWRVRLEADSISPADK
jgi:hypothetical protein